MCHNLRHHFLGKCMLKLVGTTKPKSKSKCVDTYMIDFMKKKENLAALEKILSKEFGTETNVNERKPGSVVLHLQLHDYSVIDHIAFLSRSGILSKILKHYLISPELLAACSVQDVSLIATLDETGK